MKYFLFATTIFLGITLIFIGSVQALTVSPPRIEIFADAGENFKGKFLLMNEQLEEKTFYTSFENFEANGEQGSPSFVPGQDGLASWIKAVPEVVLMSGEQKEISYEINIPKNTPNGGYFAAIFLSTNPPQQDGNFQVVVGAKIGILVLLRVGENITEGGGLLEFGTKDFKRFFTTLPISFDYRFSNEGGDRLKPEGEIVIKNSIGLTAATLSANPTEGNILPGSIRKFTVNWEPKIKGETNKNEPKGFFQIAKKQAADFTFGIYKAKLNLEYGRKEIDIIKDSFYFFVFPWQLLSFLIVSIVILGLILKIGIKKYNRWIISKVKGDKK